MTVRQQTISEQADSNTDVAPLLSHINETYATCNQFEFFQILAFSIVIR